MALICSTQYQEVKVWTCKPGFCLFSLELGDGTQHAINLMHRKHLEASLTRETSFTSDQKRVRKILDREWIFYHRTEIRWSTKNKNHGESTGQQGIYFPYFILFENQLTTNTRRNTSSLYEVCASVFVVVVVTSANSMTLRGSAIQPFLLSGSQNVGVIINM